MISILYEDRDVIVVDKPAGVESQEARGLAPDMVSQIRSHLAGRQRERQELSTKQSTGYSGANGKSRPPYVGVIHRLDKPVRGVMVYAKNQKAAASLSRQIQQGRMKKTYAAVVCGKPVENQGTYVDYLLKNGKTNCSQIVDKSCENSKEARLNYRVVSVCSGEKWTGQDEQLSLLDIELLTGRHHQIRVQLAGHQTPVFGDNRYGKISDCGKPLRRQPLALCARQLTFYHPETGKEMTFQIEPTEGAFRLFTSALKPSPDSPRQR